MGPVQLSELSQELKPAPARGPDGRQFRADGASAGTAKRQRGTAGLAGAPGGLGAPAPDRQGRHSSLGDPETAEEDAGLLEQEAGAVGPEAAGEPEPLSPASAGESQPFPPQPPPPSTPAGPSSQDQHRGGRVETEPGRSWPGPNELEPVLQDGQRCVRARRSLAEGLSWGPFRGNIQSKASSPGQVQPAAARLGGDPHTARSNAALTTLSGSSLGVRAPVSQPQKPGPRELGLQRVRWAGRGPQAEFPAADPRTTVHSSHPSPSQALELGPGLRRLEQLPQAEAPWATHTARHSPAAVLREADAGPGPRAPGCVARPSPWQDVFPCKDCGIWYRSERNLQAHLLYYCASRQTTGSPAAAADEKPKETYPNERVCPFPQCRKSCPSASSLEIHMRSHSGERPFVCLICLSAFTTKANCERHLKVHTDTLSGVCHSCGFISTTRDILYSHLVTNHMVCQPGSKAEIYSPGAGHPAAKLPPDSLASFQQHTAPHGPLASTDLGLAPTPSPGLDRKALAEATNGEARAAPQNGGSSEPPAAPRAIKTEAATEEPEAEPGPPAAASRTPSPPSPAPARVKAELSSPTPGSSPGPGELGLAAGTLFLPQFPAAPPASEILAKMSELVHSRLQAGAGAQAGLFAGAPKGATCFERLGLSEVNTYHVSVRMLRPSPKKKINVLPTRRKTGVVVPRGGSEEGLGIGS
ncbi:zinc finger protein ZFPM1 [Puma concolor]|uniref:Zinc finger protein ZFPM1 n=1 Tax=Puma concolor TaxID=9696 RepID=A0A6P6HMN5_PUMCO|nr:zinc finger protein ZFPM1 [Puma concolor]